VATKNAATIGVAQNPWAMIGFESMMNVNIIYF
jgi:hypothetical protein